jgi:hypothetical protein
MTESKNEKAKMAHMCLLKLREIEGLTIQGLDSEGLHEKHEALQNIKDTIGEVFEFPLDEVVGWVEKVLKDLE